MNTKRMFQHVKFFIILNTPLVVVHYTWGGLTPKLLVMYALGLFTFLVAAWDFLPSSPEEAERTYLINNKRKIHE